MSRWVATAVACLGVVAAARAGASGLDAPRVGSGRSGPVTADAAAVFWNPGALGQLRRGEVVLGGQLVIGKVAYQRVRLGEYQYGDRLSLAKPDRAAIDAGLTGAAEPVTAEPFAAAPEAFAALPLAERFVVAAGAYTPQAAKADFAPDGAQRFALRSAFITATHVSAAVAFRPTPAFSVGGSVSYVLGTASLSKVQDFAAVDDFAGAVSRDPLAQRNELGSAAPTQVRELDVLSRPIWIEDAMAHGATFSVGLLARPTPRTQLGLAYQHGTPLRLRGRFTLDMNDDFFTRDLSAQGLAYKPLVRGDAELSIRLPPRILAGLAVEPGASWRVALSGAYVFYSTVDAFDIRLASPDLAQPTLGVPAETRQRLARGWSDTVALELEVSHRPSAAVSLALEAGYQSPAAPDATLDVASIDGHRVLAGASASYALASGTTLVADALVQHMLPRTVTTSAFDLGNGTYELTLLTLGFHVQVPFGAPSGR